jgi:2-hydroxycyclohexanecarboxyl-CoA dehydrogenase
MDMQARTVAVTGGASGIGKATAFLLAREGARVLIGDVDETGGRTAAAEGAAERLAIGYLPLDLTDKPSIDSFVAAVHQRVARVDGLVNGAGWDQIQPFLENPPEMWDRVIAVIQSLWLPSLSKLHRLKVHCRVSRWPAGRLAQPDSSGNTGV